MKKLLSIILSICMLLSITAGLNLTAYADTYKGDCGTGVTWELDTEMGELTISGTGDMENYASYDDVPWYSYWKSIKTVTINSGVTSIGAHAFHNCYYINSVTIPNTVTSICEYAFDYVYSITSITIPDSVTSIGKYAFEGTYLTSITIPNSVTSIGDAAFMRCSGLTSVTIPSSVTSIGGSAFSQCEKLASIVVDPSNANYLSQDGALFTKDKTTLINYPVAKTNTSYTIPDSVTSIGSYAFSYCSNLKSIEIPNSVTNICNYAFHQFTGLTSITIPNSVTNIGGYAFLSCSGLISVSIPDSVISIGNCAFQACTALTSIDVDPSNTVYSSQDGVLFNKDKSTLILYPASKPETSYTIPDAVTSIRNDSFLVCKSLTSVTIPDSVTSIGSFAFSGCEGLTSIIMGNGITTIGSSAFNKCTGLTDVYYTGTEDQWNSISISDSSNDYLINATRHYNYVPLCAEHTWDDGTVTTPATCTSTGVKTYKCTVCTDGAKTEIIPMAEHTPEVMPAVPATCTETGLTEGSKCSVCGTILVEQKVVDKLPAPTPEPATQPTTEPTTTPTTPTTPTTTTTSTTDTPVATKVSVPKITLKTVKSKKSKQITVSWKKNTKVTGYEVQYSTDKKFKKSVKKATIKKNKTTSTTLKKLNGKKKYYVRIRAYKTVNGKKYYSSWSKAMTVTTKK